MNVMNSQSHNYSSGFLERSQIPFPLHPKGDWWPWKSLDNSYRDISECTPSPPPSVSIIVPTFNCGLYLEESVRSLLLQDYPYLQIIVVDGGSTDGTQHILEHYHSVLDIVISEPDDGQADAINKGFDMCIGDYVNWLNADDMLAPNALRSIFSPKTVYANIIAGRVQNINDSTPPEAVGMPTINRGFTPQNFLYGVGNIPFKVDFCYHQPGVFLMRAMINQIGSLNPGYRYIFDQEYMIRVMSIGPHVTYVDHIVAFFRLRPGSKTVSESRGFIQEVDMMQHLLIGCPSSKVSAFRVNNAIQARKWYDKISGLHKNGSQLRDIISIVFLMSINPAVRFNRFTLGYVVQSIKRLMANN